MDIIEILSNFKFTNEFWQLILPVALMGIDFITGLTYAWSTRTFKSKKMRSGLTKKVGEITILVIGELFTAGMRLPFAIMAGVSLYIMFMEFMSIMENLKKMGVPIPGFISKVLNTVDLALKEEDVAEALKKMDEMENKIKALEYEKKTP